MCWALIPVQGQRQSFKPHTTYSYQAFLRVWGPQGTGQQLAYSPAWKKESSFDRCLVALKPLYTMNSLSIYFCFDLVTEINWLFPFSTSIMSVSSWIWKFPFRYLCSKKPQYQWSVFLDFLFSIELSQLGWHKPNLSNFRIVWVQRKPTEGVSILLNSVRALLRLSPRPTFPVLLNFKLH